MSAKRTPLGAARPGLRRLLGVLAVVALLVGVPVGLAVVGSLLGGEVAPSATRPCEQAFADRLAADPLLAVPGPADVGEPQDGDRGCQDDDGGGVSYVEQTRVTALGSDAVAAHFADAARRLGWQHVRVTRSRDPIDAYSGAGVCADRVADGHIVELSLVFPADDDAVPPGLRQYQLSLTGDAGNFPRCPV